MRFLYSLLTWVMQPLVRIKLRRRAQAEPLYGEKIPERFGFYSTPYNTGGRYSDISYIWIHSVSLGETRAVAPLITELRKQFPAMRLLLTNGTATGREAGRTLLQEGDIQVWQPWDSIGTVTRFLDTFQPRIGLLMETEVWPNLTALCAERQIPLCLVNARFSDKSLRQALRMQWLARPAYAGLHAVWAQTLADANRLKEIGAPVRGVMGNFKFDVTPDAAQLKQGRAWRQMQKRPVIAFTNSREGEETLFLDAIKEIQGVQWLLVPRHPQRFDAIAALCVEKGFSVSRRSQWATNNKDAPETADICDIWLGDSMGEMALYYGMADVALLGGSFAPLGGHNLIESTACECPIVMGLHTFNFAQAAELAVAAGAGFVQENMQAAVQYAVHIAQSPTELEKARHAARSLGEAHRGAAARTADAVVTLLAESTYPAQ
ncbi:MAG: hypothetical protein RIR79_536 [Pseudomonadota bacterium]|jgi:3-deoxy-D-manno-octulosonic-acid transferase